MADAANNAYSILLDADGAGILEFKFTDANDVVTLQAGSTIDDFGTLKVTSGTLDATLASITGVTRVEVASGVKLTLVQVREIPVLVSNDVTGRIEIVVNSIAEATELATLVQNQTIQFFGAAGNITVTAAAGASVTTDQITAQMSIVTSNVRPASEAPAASSGETDTGAGVAAGARPATDTGDAGSGAASGGGTGVTDGGGTADPGFRLIAQSSQVFKLAEGYGDVAMTMQDGVLRFTTAASNSVTAVNTDVSGIQVDGLTLTASADVLSSMAVTGAGHLIMTGLAEDTVVTGLGVTGVTTLAGVACADQIAQIAAGNANGTIVGTDLTAINGTAANVVQALAAFNTAPAAFTAELRDADGVAVTVTDLSAIGAATTGTVTVANAVVITGSESQVTAALVTDGTKVTAQAATIAVTGTTTAHGLNAIAAATSGVVTATITGTAAALNAADGGLTTLVTDAITITLDAGVAAATDLTGLAAKTRIAVDANEVTAISGTGAELVAVIAANIASESTLAINGNYTVTLTAGGAAATLAQLIAINNATSGMITLGANTTAGALSGSASDLTAALAGFAANTLSGDLDITGDAISIADFTLIGPATSGVVTYTLADGQQALGAQNLADVAGFVAIVAGSANFGSTDVTVSLSDTAMTIAQITALVGTGLTLGNLSYTLADGQQALGAQDLADVAGLVAIVAGSANFGSTDVTVSLSGTATTIAQITALVGTGLTLGNLSYTLAAGNVEQSVNGTFTGGAASYIVTADAGNDTITGGSGTNIILAGAGNDTITSGTGDDIIMGGAGNDTITAGAGNDTIMGGADDDTITAGAGNDIITSGSGADTVTPGTGLDTIVYTDVANEARDIITNFTTIADGAAFGAGTDKLQFSAADLASVAGFVAYSAGGVSLDIDGDAAGSVLVAFVSGTGAQSATAAQAAFLFNQTTGDLSFDADGTGDGAAIVIATLTGVVDLATADFTFIA
ncbi:beta strand repeat-containing protein [Yoonia vestfoldensis]|uniref:beta strand repeat-containing protein n=1 Tax=Yoonia vestfoldensis TaxID=245188 RepID=UPI000305335E|nr:calcium-binding protein [Yoonia vestfoldensis]